MGKNTSTSKMAISTATWDNPQKIVMPHYVLTSW